MPKLQTITDVSIHAPVKGATYMPDELEPKHPVSIHAPVKGATLYLLYAVYLTRRFNPRAREGRDDIVADFPVVVGVFQSTRP